MLTDRDDEDEQLQLALALSQSEAEARASGGATGPRRIQVRSHSETDSADIWKGAAAVVPVYGIVLCLLCCI